MLFLGEIIALYAVLFLVRGIAASETAGCYISSQRCVSLDGSTCATPQPAKHSTIDGWPCQRWDCPHPRPQSRATTGDNACINDHNDADGTWCFIADPDGPLWQRCWTMCPELTVHSLKGLKACYNSTAKHVSTAKGKPFGDAPCALSPLIKAYTSRDEWNNYWPDCSNGTRAVTHEFPTFPAYPTLNKFRCPSVHWTLVEDSAGLVCLRLYKLKANKYTAWAICRGQDIRATLGIFGVYNDDDISIYEKFVTDSGGSDYDVWLSGEGKGHSRMLEEEGYECSIIVPYTIAIGGCLFYNGNTTMRFHLGCCSMDKYFVCQIRQKLPCIIY